uniref:Uncharacterized protein n=1 Tax=Sipha flava TaxID=143950 RepID=A0A2S2R9C1_9HEMI
MTIIITVLYRRRCVRTRYGSLGGARGTGKVFDTLSRTRTIRFHGFRSEEKRDVKMYSSRREGFSVDLTSNAMGKRTRRSVSELVNTSGTCAPAKSSPFVPPRRKVDARNRRAEYETFRKCVGRVEIRA